MDDAARKRLDAIAIDVRRLRVEVINRARDAGELLDGEEASEAAANRFTATRMLLDAALDRYFDAAEIARGVCPEHGPSVLYVACSKCVEAVPSLRPAHASCISVVRESEEAAQ